MANDIKARIEKKKQELKELAEQLTEVNSLRGKITNSILAAHGALKELEDMLPKDEAKKD